MGFKLDEMNEASVPTVKSVFNYALEPPREPSAQVLSVLCM